MLNALFDYQQLCLTEQAILREMKGAGLRTKVLQVKQAFEQNKQQYLQLVEEIAQLDQQQKQLPQQIEQHKQKITAEQDAIYQSSTSSSRILQARETQVSSLTERLLHLEKEIMRLEDDLLSKKQQAEALRASMAEQQEEFRMLKAEYQKQQDDFAQRLRAVDEQKKQLEPDINPSEMNWYLHKRERFHGTPLAKIGGDNICSGCRTSVTAACYKRVSSGRSASCENCGRTLFVD